jgi:hypothetical protein
MLPTPFIPKIGIVPFLGGAPTGAGVRRGFPLAGVVFFLAAGFFFAATVASPSHRDAPYHYRVCGLGVNRR